MSYLLYVLTEHVSTSHCSRYTLSVRKENMSHLISPLWLLYLHRQSGYSLLYEVTAGHIMRQVVFERWRFHMQTKTLFRLVYIAYMQKYSYWLKFESLISKRMHLKKLFHPTYAVFHVRIVHSVTVYFKSNTYDNYFITLWCKNYRWANEHVKQRVLLYGNTVLKLLMTSNLL